LIPCRFVSTFVESLEIAKIIIIIIHRYQLVASASIILSSLNSASTGGLSKGGRGYEKRNHSPINNNYANRSNSTFNIKNGA